MSEKNYLAKLPAWNADTASQLAAEDKLQLTAAHLEVLDVARQFFDQYGFSPSMRPLCKTVATSYPLKKAAAFICCSYSRKPGQTGRQIRRFTETEKLYLIRRVKSTLKAIDPQLYPAQLEAKQARFNETLKGLKLPQIEVFDSAPSQFRMRAEFRIWHEDGRAHYAMNRAGEKRPYIIDSFPIGGPLINKLMTPLIEAINAEPVLSRRLFSAEFLTTLSGEVLVTLIYHRPVDEVWQKAARQLQTDLNIMVIGRSRKQKVVLERDYVLEKLTVDGREYQYQQVESGFTQPNAEVNQKMLSWASSCCAIENNSAENNDLLELYCGNGNFTAVLAQHFKQVLATEISKISVRSAETNFATIKVDNVRGADVQRGIYSGIKRRTTFSSTERYRP